MWWFVVIVRRTIFRIRDRSCVASCYWLCGDSGIVLSCRIIAHGFSAEVKQRRARLVRGCMGACMTVTDRGLSHIHGFSAKVPRRVTLADEWPDDFRKVEVVTLTLPSRVMEGWIFYVSGLTIMSVGMTGRRMTGRHRRTGTASIYY